MRGWGGAERPRDARLAREELEVRTSDLASLRAVVEEPPEGIRLRGTFVLAHAMFARKSTFLRGISALLTTRGFRTVAFDFRGHGDSLPPRSGEDFGYDDLVRFDLPAVVECARARGGELPVCVLGHSLGGHVALASVVSGRATVDGLLLVASNVWHGEAGSWPGRQMVERAIARGGLLLVERLGKIPARKLRLGSDDEPRGYINDVLGFARERRWASRDGADDYLAGLARVAVPLAAVASDADRLICPPALAERFARRTSGPVAMFRVSRGDDGGPPPSHMGLVTTTRAHDAIGRAVAFLEARLGDAHASQARP